MNLANDTWNDSMSPEEKERGHLILTTEDKSIFEQRSKYVSMGESFPIDFVVNTQDSLQGSGDARLFAQHADDIILSSLVALQMQFHAGRVVYGNCCSNFHLVLFDLLQEGCGVTIPQRICLQETQDYNVCCHWDKSKNCDAIRAKKKNDKQSGKQER